jgi:hypothetical protein
MAVDVRVLDHHVAADAHELAIRAELALDVRRVMVGIEDDHAAPRGAPGGADRIEHRRGGRVAYEER